MVHYLYMTSAPYDNGVYQTQVLDWLNLYRTKGVDFTLIQFFPVHPSLLKKSKKDKESIRKAYNGKSKFYWRLPQQILPSYINKVIFLRAVRPFLKKEDDRVVIFSRSHIAKEIEYLRHHYPNRVTYYYDLRGAFPEEYRDTLKYKNSFGKQTCRILGDIYFSSFCCQKEADKIFAVSKPLMDYYEDTFGTGRNKFVLYPCLSTITKFYYDKQIREKTRKELGFNDSDDVFIYSGGLDYSYSFVEEFVDLFKQALQVNKNAKLLVLAKKITPNFLSIVENNPDVKSRLKTVENIPNSMMINYLNAADIGFLLRNNTLLNNVASPVKFAEYQLCGLPVIISEAVLDYSIYCIKHHSGVVLSNKDFENKDFSFVANITKDCFDRQQVADDARINLSKEMVVDTIVESIKVDK